MSVGLSEWMPAGGDRPWARTQVTLTRAAASRRFLLELEQRMEESIVISDVCDIVFRYAANHFSVYITYVSNQTYQERTYKQLL